MRTIYLWALGWAWQTFCVGVKVGLVNLFSGQSIGIDENNTLGQSICIDENNTFYSSIKTVGAYRFGRFVGVRAWHTVTNLRCVQGYGIGGLWALEWAWHISVTNLRLRTRLRNLNLRSHFSVFDSLRDIRQFSIFDSF